MKIVHIIDYYQPKLGYQEAFLARNHANLGHEVHVITSDRYASGLYPMAQAVLGPRLVGTGSFTEDGVCVHRLPINFELQGRVWLRGVSSCLHKINPDLVIIHGVLSAASIQASLAKRSGAVFKLIIDDHMVPTASRPIAALVYILFSKSIGPLIRKYADSFVSTHKDSTDFMISKYGLKKDMITFIPLGCDTNLFRRNSRVRSQVRQSLNLHKDDVLFIYAGKLTPEKGPHLLAKAGFNLAKRFDNVKILLLGNGTPNYVSMIRKLGVSSGNNDVLLFRDLVPNHELPKFYSAADVGVWPLQCSLTMIEAMACHLPIIIADNSGTPDRVNHENGFMYKNGDIYDLQQQMQKLMNSNLRSEMGRNARLYAERLDWSRIAQSFLEIR